MKKLVLVVLVTTLTLAPPVPAQSCTLSAYNSCLAIYPGVDWFAIVLQGYCAFVRTFLCDAGI